MENLGDSVIVCGVMTVFPCALPPALLLHQAAAAMLASPCRAHSSLHNRTDAATHSFEERSLEKVIFPMDFCLSIRDVFKAFVQNKQVKFHLILREANRTQNEQAKLCHTFSVTF